MIVRYTESIPSVKNRCFDRIQAQFPSQDANVADAETADRKDAALGFIDDISLTSVFMQAWSYLNTAGELTAQFDNYTGDSVKRKCKGESTACES